jgi:hypothetical protein
MFFSNLLMSGSTFSPLSLFASGEQGVWYDPNDLSSMWQDAQGTTAVTAVEQAVGLILDRREGRGLGTELVTNNTFSTDTDWTKGTDWTIGSGVATKTAGTAAVLSQAVSLTAGFTYRLVYTITRTAGAITPQFTGGSTVAGTARSAAGTFVEVLTAVTDNTTLEFSADASFAGTVDNVYVKRVSGNDAWQLTSASRPVLSARVNLLTKTEELDSADWTRSNLTATDGATDPNSGSTAETLAATGANGTVTQSVTAAATAYVFSVWLKRKTGTGNVDITCHSSGTWVTQSITSSWARYSVTQTLTAGSHTPGIRIVTSGDEVEAWGADLRVSNDGVGLPAYQRVNTSTDYDTAGFPMYLRFDGTDDSLATAAINFSATDKMSVFAGVRKLSDAATAIVVETNTNGNTDGSFSLLAPSSSGAVSYRYQSRGTLTVNSGSTLFAAAPNTSVITGLSDISGDTVTLRANTVEIEQVTNDQGTGNYSANQSINIGRRNNVSIPFNGRIYSLIVRGASSTAGQISDTEGWVNSRTRAY